MARKYEQVPAAPFARWLNKRFAYWAVRAKGDVNEAAALLADEIGWGTKGADGGVRTLFRYRKQLKGSSKIVNGRRVKVDVPTDLFRRLVVEEALFSAGVPFEDLYPDIAARETVELEPDQWCLRCEETKTPIDGRCPFCESKIGPETGQALQGKLRAA